MSDAAKEFSEDIVPFEKLCSKVVSRRDLILGLAGLVGAAVAVDATISPFDWLDFKKHREYQHHRYVHRAELKKQGQRLYAESFFASNPTLVRSGERDIVIARDPALAGLLEAEYHVARSDNQRDGLQQFRGIAECQLFKESPTWLSSPPHLNIRDYDDKPSFLTVGPEDSNLVGLPYSPVRPGGLLAIFDGGEEFEGDITISMEKNKIDITNHGQGRHTVHLFALKPS